MEEEETAEDSEVDSEEVEMEEEAKVVVKGGAMEEETEVDLGEVGMEGEATAEDWEEDLGEEETEEEAKVGGTEEGKGVVGGGMAVGMEARAAVSARTIQQP
jgi:hypothetical protein